MAYKRVSMPELAKHEVERTTVYLTPLNRLRLSALRRGEKSKKINDALNRAFEEEERKAAFEAFMANLNAVEARESVMPSIEAVRLLRKGKDHEVADKRRV